MAAPAIERRIYLLRGHQIVFAKVLNQAVKRNRSRFPEDFMFQLTPEEATSLRSQIVTLDAGNANTPPNRRGRHTKYLPYAFTEQGVAMLSSVLSSEHAVQVNIAIMRAFVRLRDVLSASKDIAAAVEILRRDQQSHGRQIREIYTLIESLLAPPPDEPRRRIGFGA